MHPDSLNNQYEEQFYLRRIAELEEHVIRLEQQLEEQSELKSYQSNQQHAHELEEQVLQLQQLQPNWERQISEIVDWVGQEKEARNYLQQLAAKLTKEVEELQIQQAPLLPQYSPPTPAHLYTTSKQNYTTWQERRSARVDKQELLQLQLELQVSIERFCERASQEI